MGITGKRKRTGALLTGYPTSTEEGNKDNDTSHYKGSYAVSRVATPKELQGAVYRPSGEHIRSFH
jgi:hypothetical protein